MGDKGPTRAIAFSLNGASPHFWSCLNLYSHEIYNVNYIASCHVLGIQGISRWWPWPPSPPWSAIAALNAPNQLSYSLKIVALVISFWTLMCVKSFQSPFLCVILHWSGLHIRVDSTILAYYWQWNLLSFTILVVSLSLLLLLSFP